MAEVSKFANPLKSPFLWIPFALILPYFVLAVGLTSHSNSGIITTRSSPIMQEAHAIGRAMYAYANDHNGAYPVGKSSTEVFQQLIDENYAPDSTIFFDEWLKIPGKTKARSNILKPENVSYDVTVPVNSDSSDLLPLVFSTGFRIHYVSGGSATPLFPWAKEWTGIPVFYKGNNAVWLRDDGQPDGMVTNFISTAFNPAGKKYVQLTPDGPLGP